MTSLSFSATFSMGGGEGEMFKKSDKVIREALGAGRWFPGDRLELNSMIQGYMANAKTSELSGPVVSAIAPHAGYVYSGKVAGYTFRAIRDSAAAGYNPETVVVLGLSHRGGFEGVALMDGDAVRTPLGEVEIDKEALKELSAGSSRIAGRKNHSGYHRRSQFQDCG
jgi:AmmeMemoRadiSam system protein B